MPAGESIFNSATIKHFENLQNFSHFVGCEVYIRKEKVWKNVLNRRDN